MDQTSQTQTVTKIPRHKKLKKVTITYCDKNNNVVTRDIDLNSVGGLIWHKAVKPNTNLKTPKIPGHNKETKGPCGPTPKDPDDDTCCYWTGAVWICPDDPDDL